MKSPTFVKQGLLGIFWQEESNNRAHFAKLLRHRKLCMSFNISERLISENFLLRSRVSHVTQLVLLASFPGPRPASRRLQYGYCKRREAGCGPGNEAIVLSHSDERTSSFYRVMRFSHFLVLILRTARFDALAAPP